MRQATHLVNDCLFQVTLDLHQQVGVLTTDGAQGADGVGPIQIRLAVHVLNQAGCDDDAFVLPGAHVLDDQVHLRGQWSHMYVQGSSLLSARGEPAVTKKAASRHVLMEAHVLSEQHILEDSK